MDGRPNKLGDVPKNTKTINLLLCKLMDNHQICSTPITSPKWKKVLHPMTSPIKRHPVTSQKTYHPKTSFW
jgi:hypothetical protein